jgi:hypothetical protein
MDDEQLIKLLLLKKMESDLNVVVVIMESVILP